MQTFASLKSHLNTNSYRQHGNVIVKIRYYLPILAVVVVLWVLVGLRYLVFLLAEVKGRHLFAGCGQSAAYPVGHSTGLRGVCLPGEGQPRKHRISRPTSLCVGVRHFNFFT